MNTIPNEPTCPRCGKPVSPDAFEGLCPECLMQAGFGTITADPEKEKRSPFVPPTPEELAAHFPQLEIIGLLGRGGMGAVYKARQTHLDRIVALKILPPGVNRDPSFAERFVREARALAKLHHPNIVTLYESGRADELFYFLMEFVDGVNLRQLLAAGTISPKDALAIVPQICDALQFAHDRGIVHRDIKPENILLSKAGQVKIADFGVAKLVAGEPVESPSVGDAPPGGAQTEAGRVIGTPQYMAPEQFSHPLDVDNRADIYALGVVFYQMLTGELPVGKFERPSSKVRIDARLDEVVLRALEKKPELRYQQASILKTQVETIAATPGAPGVETISPKPDSSGRFLRFLVALLRWLGVAFTVFVLTVAGGYYVTNYVLSKVYTATAQIQVLPRSEAVGGSVPNDGSTESDFQAEFEVMQSSKVLTPVITELQLDKTWAKREKMSLDALPPQAALTYLNGHLKLDFMRGTNIIDITVSSEAPKEAADIANAIAVSYINMRIDEKEQRNSQDIDSLHDQIAQQQKAVEQIRQDLGQKGIEITPGTDNQGEADLDKRKQDLLQAQEDYDAHRVLLASVVDLPDDKFLDTLDGLGREPSDIAALHTDVLKETTDITNLLQNGFDENTPQIQSKRAELDAKKKQLADLVAGLRRAMDLDTDTAKSRVTLLQKEVDDLKNKIGREPNVLAPFRDAQHNLDHQQRLLDALNVRLQQVIVDNQLQQNPVAIISRAEPPAFPSKPNQKFDYLISVLAGFLLSVVVASFVELSLWLRASTTATSGSGKSLAAPSVPSAGFSQKGRTPAIAGAILQPGSVIGLTMTNLWLIQAFDALHYRGETNVNDVAEVISTLLVATIIGILAFFAGLIFLCIALTVSRYRANWFFRFLTIYSWPLLLVFPFGTAAGILFLVYCLSRRDEFNRL